MRSSNSEIQFRILFFYCPKGNLNGAANSTPCCLGEASDSLHWESTYLASLRRQNRKADSRADAERTAFLPSGKGAPLAAVAHDDSVLYFDVQLEGKTAAYRVARRPGEAQHLYVVAVLPERADVRRATVLAQHEAATLDREWPWEDVLQEGTPSDATFADCITFEGRPPQIDILVEGEQHHRVTSGGTPEVVLYSPKHDAWMYNRKMARCRSPRLSRTAGR